MKTVITGALVTWTLQTPFAELTVEASTDGICSLDWGNELRNVLRFDLAETYAMPDSGPGMLEQEQDVPEQAVQSATAHAAAAVAQLREYFRGERTTFDLPLTRQGTAFQNDVWNALTDIPYGRRQSYKDIAIRIGRPLAVRAVGQANRRNPYPVIVPCHRVVGADGQLTGYDGNKIDLKLALLDMETAFYCQAKAAARNA